MKIDVKNVKVIGYGLLVMGMLLVGMPTMAQQQEWKSTSTMKGVGSTLSPTVQQVGAMSVPAMATTTTETYSPAKAPSGPRREQGVGDGRTPGEATEGSNQSPIGDAVLPLMLLACAYMGMRVILKKKKVKWLNR